MATVSLSPTPVPLAAMSSRRGPLVNNPNVANSPLRGAGTGASGLLKQKRPHATSQREDVYGQPPPKKQAVEQRLRSPSKLPRAQALPQRTVNAASTRPVPSKTKSSAATSVSKLSAEDEERKEAWKSYHKSKFPKMVFYFESVPDDVRARLTKRISLLGARQEPFFSIDVTHVITTRSIPTDRDVAQEAPKAQVEEPEPAEQPQTINPSLLDRGAARRKLLFEFRNVPPRSQLSNDPTKPNKNPRNNDVLYKAKEMGKKIWQLEKFQSMIQVLLEVDAEQMPWESKSKSRSHTSRGHAESNLVQLLQQERVNGPSDRDAKSSNRDLTYFKGPHVYIYDMDERYKPVMVREYAKVANKADGDWPQFRAVGNGRCPFVEEDPQEREYQKAREQRQALREKEKARLAKEKEAAKQEELKAVTGKRTLAEMEDGHNKVRAPEASSLNPAKAALSKQVNQNAFTSLKEGGRVFHGEPVASGLQPSNVTSAIRSQMISSQAGVTGIKAGTSKELHGLQRKVLQKAAPLDASGSSRRLTERSVDAASSRPSTLSRNTSKTGPVQESKAESKDKAQPAPLKSKKDMKPGYCENCQEKFRDFDEHIVGRRHRRFAEDAKNWTELDDLLADLKRMPKDFYMDDEYDL